MAASDARFKDMKVIADRFGDLKGLRLQQAVFETYDVGHNNVRLDYFTSDNQPMFRPHEENTRVQQVVLN
eukprot:15481526-Alexandrium_andersonii.AAC.1